LNALTAEISIGNAWAATDDAASLVTAIVALVTYVSKYRRANVGVTNDTFAIAFFTEPPNSDPRLLTTKDEIRVMFCHLVWVAYSGEEKTFLALL
jgi:hypothetical protein